MNAHSQIAAAQQTVTVCSALFSAPNGPHYTVLVDGEYYVVGRHLLAALKRGETPAELEIEPEEIDEELL